MDVLELYPEFFNHFLTNLEITFNLRDVSKIQKKNTLTLTAVTNIFYLNRKNKLVWCREDPSTPKEKKLDTSEVFLRDPTDLVREPIL